MKPTLAETIVYVREKNACRYPDASRASIWHDDLNIILSAADRTVEAEAERDDKDLLLWAFANGWIVQTTQYIPGKPREWKFLNESYKIVIAIVNGIPQMTDPLRLAIREAQAKE